MPFPLPADPNFRLEIISIWIDDAEDRLDQGENNDAMVSLNIARTLYLDLPPGCYDEALENRFVAVQGKIHSNALH
jgi:hypothetical protein